MRLVSLACVLLVTLGGCSGSNTVDTPLSSSSSSSSSSTPPAFDLSVELTNHQAILFYQREDQTYEGWGLHLWNDDQCSALDDTAISAVSWQTPQLAAGIDAEHGAYYLLDLNAAAEGNNDCINFIIHKDDDKALGNSDLVFDLNRGFIALTEHGTATVHYPLDTLSEAPLPFTLMPNQAAIFYQRSDDNYDGWGLHLWNGGNCHALADNSLLNVTWDSPKPADGIDSSRGAFFILDINQPGGCINFLVHKGDEKALGDGDLEMDLSQGNIAFTLHGSSVLNYSGTGGPVQVVQSGYAAHWVDTNTLLWNPPTNSVRVALLADAHGNIRVNNNEISGGQFINLEPGTIKSESAEKFPHISSWNAWNINTDSINPDAWLAGELVVAAFDSEDKLLAVTNVQTAGALDAYYATDVMLGAWIDNTHTHFAVWAPTAQSLALELFSNARDTEPSHSIDMSRTNKGVWSYSHPDNLHGSFYRYRVSVYHYLTDKIETLSVTDPYSLGLSVSSRLSQVVDLSQLDTMPSGWLNHYRPTLNNPEDSIIYELHIRDFSVLDSTVTPENRGKYLAFTEADSTPVKHLQSLQEAGLNTLHLLPAFDIASIDENPEERVDIGDTVSDLCALKPDASPCTNNSPDILLVDLLSSFDPTTDQAQALMEEIRGLDSFNWGYDPFHFTAPEGSYATGLDGFQRIIEFRAMVQALHEMGFRVVMDAVYNHTNASGLWQTSVLDKIVPGYYHRRNEFSGEVERSSCCDNTATEHTMMERLMIDSLVVWARDYKIDGFRFDLMGHHMVSNILAARDAVQEVDPDTYFYGEGWNFGEVVDNRRGINAVQINMAGTGVGSFNDRLRDAVRGGAPFDSGNALRANQGYGTGLYYYPNELAHSDSLSHLLDLSDRLRVNLAGSLASYAFVDRYNHVVNGDQVPYFDLFAGYTQDPQESINYISKHDNQTLWDNLQYKAATNITSRERTRMHNFALSLPMLAQGIPFIHMGSELLRSKSMARDSYDAGDWYNRVDFGGQHNNWNRGLPPAEKDSVNYALISNLVENANANPTSEDIALAKTVFKEWLRIRTSSPLLRLTSAEAIQDSLAFHNTGSEQIPGLIVMSLTDTHGIDPNYNALVIVFNPSNTEQVISSPQGQGLVLHPVQLNSADAITRTAKVEGDILHVPALTTAVFVKP